MTATFKNSFVIIDNAEMSYAFKLCYNLLLTLLLLVVTLLT